MFTNAQTPGIEGSESCLALLEDLVTSFEDNEKSYMTHLSAGLSAKVIRSLLLNSTLEKSKEHLHINLLKVQI